ncbi:Rpn family recombination-promoting nuclease/putative transposase [Lachnotalea sp. AF33-28]|uniref:Rpn family recombination-promoting nuclease/putative transposase n=1 Tax=Lachnotalea sp. AF33-28 TaxID=2292046 RepID=UPI000E4934C8|nr:Rpn family recombination-promoting nuclease/putative transposase [Lachnotalea sp. AF33-28]RHP35128.1 Rpn family recombination-promoting nuclease/putative transposase [Lachnotalea sp. AF33-28]
MGTDQESYCGNRMDSYEERRNKVRRFQLTSDIFFCKVLEDKEACQEVIRILLGHPSLVVKDVKTQYSIRNIENRSVVLDVLAEDTDGRMVNIEMQVSEDEDHQRRARYYQASMDMSFLEKGCPYEELPELYLIFITEKDFLNQKTGICYIDRVVRSRGTVTDNGVHEVYANLTYGCEDERIDELLRYMKKSDSDYQTEVFPNVVRKVRYLKEQKEGVEIMCRILEEERNEGIMIGMEKGIQAFICDNREENIPRERVLVKLQKRFELSEDEAEMWLEKYWG